MAAIKYIKRTVALDGSSISDTLPESLFTGEQAAHMFIIAAVRSGESLTLSGTVTGIFLNANDEEVPLTGSIVDGAATVTLSDACYHVNGRFTLTISVAGAVIYKANGRISRRSSGTAYDPTGVIPNLDEIQAEIAEMREATAAANTAAQNANDAASDVKDPVAKANSGLQTFDPSLFVRGYIEGTTEGTYYQNRIKSAEIWDVGDTNALFEVADEFIARFNLYDNSGTYLYSSGWMTKYALYANSRFRVEICRSGEPESAHSTPADIALYASKLAYQTHVQDEINAAYFGHREFSLLDVPMESGMIGSYGQNDDSEYNYTRKMRTSDYLFVFVGDIISVNHPTLKYYLALYDVNKQFVSIVPWMTTDYTVSKDGYIRVVIGGTGDNVLPEADKAYLRSSVVIQGNISTVLENYGRSQLNFDFDIQARTFISSYNTLDGWEPHAKAFSAMMEDVENTEGFMFFTDTHFMSKQTESEWKRYAYPIFAYIEQLYYSSPCSFVLHGGDWLGTGDTRENALYKLSVISGVFRRNFDRYALLVGNHETGSQMEGTTEMTYGTLAATLLANVGKTYYTFDANTFRIYCFDSWDTAALDAHGKQQVVWFAQSLERETSEHIVIAIHMLYDSGNLMPLGDELTKCANAYNAKTTYTYDGVTYDFSGAVGKISFAIAGHRHLDETGIVNGIPYILTTNTTEYSDTVFTNLPLPIDLMKIDWKNKKLTAYRAAREQAGTTRELTVL